VLPTLNIGMETADPTIPPTAPAANPPAPAAPPPAAKNAAPPVAAPTGMVIPACSWSVNILPKSNINGNMWISNLKLCQLTLYHCFSFVIYFSRLRHAQSHPVHGYRIKPGYFERQYN
jgi:hypothetical protein